MTAKTMIRKFVLGLFAMAAFGAASAVLAADLKAGETKVKEVCQACHGADGNSQNTDYPKLGGQYPDYLAKALRDYKSGARKNPIMGAFAGTLSTADIENVSAYYAAQPAVLVTRH
jgi:cytochrome c553